MPFKSEAQRRYLYSQHPDVAAEFQAHTPKGKKLPNRVTHKVAGRGKSAPSNKYGRLFKAGAKLDPSQVEDFRGVKNPPKGHPVDRGYRVRIKPRTSPN